MMPLSIREAPG